MTRAVVCVAIVLVLGGCGAKHWEVKDTKSGDTYYTTKMTDKDGVVMLHDPRSGRKVTLQNPEVRKISAREYREGLKDMPTMDTGSSR